MTFDAQLSAQVAAETHPRPDQCWNNASLALLTVVTLVEQSAYYCEGYAAYSTLKIPREHAWVELEDGTVIDTTPQWIENGISNLYEVTRRYTVAEVEARVIAGAGMPFCIYYDKLMKEHQDTLLRLIDRLKF